MRLKYEYAEPAFTQFLFDVKRNVLDLEVMLKNKTNNSNEINMLNGQLSSFYLIEYFLENGEMIDYTDKLERCYSIIEEKVKLYEDMIDDEEYESDHSSITGELLAYRYMRYLLAGYPKENTDN